MCCPNFKSAQTGVSFGFLCQKTWNQIRYPSIVSCMALLSETPNPKQAFSSCPSALQQLPGSTRMQQHGFCLWESTSWSVPTCVYKCAVFTYHEKDQHNPSDLPSPGSALVPLLLPCSDFWGRMTANFLFRSFASRLSCARIQLPNAQKRDGFKILVVGQRSAGGGILFMHVSMRACEHASVWACGRASV